MGYAPQPIPLNKEKFLKRLRMFGDNASLKDLDPDFYQWVEGNRNVRRMLVGILGCVFVGFVFILL